MEVDKEELPMPPTSPATKNNHQSLQTQLAQPQMNMNGDEDPYKPEGSITLKIENLSKFAREGGDARRLSEPIYIRGLPWKILAIPREMGRRGPMGGPTAKSLGYFLQCNAENNDQAWSCAGSATLKILAQNEGKEDHSRKISHVFHAKENDWGFAQFMTFEGLMQPESGWYDEGTDSIILHVDVTADAPHGVNWDSKKDTGCIGLKNQGATCYMNSILQTLFFTNKLRQAVYQMPTEEDDPDSSVALAMQRVFYELQFSDSPVGTKKLTKSFGWDSIDSFLQHDVQEFCRVLLDNLEDKMKNTKVADTIPSLFKGRMKSYVKCKEVDFESSREECFYDLQLNVKNKSNVFESFKDYIEPEILDGDNKYDAGEYGLQPAEKGLKFLSFPPVLHLQLMRFQYDAQLDTNVKVNDRFEFPLELDLNELVENDESDKANYTYKLYAVLTHAGDFHSGHYVVFLNTGIGEDKEKFCKFDDEVVCRVSGRQAMTMNFGGNEQEVLQKHTTSAYMLVYVRKDEIDDVLCTVTEDHIPDHLKSRFENEKKLEAQRKHEREEAKEMCEIILITDEEMNNYHGFELFDHSIVQENYPKRYKVFKSTKLSDLYNIVIGPKLGLDANKLRLWEFSKNDDLDFNKGFHYQHLDDSESPRPRIEMPPDVSKTLGEEEMDNTLLLKRDSTKLIYVEMENPKFEWPPQEDSILVFVKYYNFDSQQSEYKGPLHLSTQKSLFSQFALINRLIDLPEETKLNTYLEISPSRIESIRMLDRSISNDFASGIILIVEQADVTETGAQLPTTTTTTTDEQLQTKNEKNKRVGVQEYFKNLYNQIEVEAHINLNGIGPSKLNSPTPPIRGKISLEWSIQKTCEWLGKELDYDLEKILIWKVAQPSEKPFIYLSIEQYRLFRVRELLNLNSNYYDPRQKRVYKMYYTKLPFKFLNLDERKHLHIQMMHDDYQITEISVFPRKHGTVGDILKEAKAEFKFNPNGTGILRLVYVYSSANISRVFHVLKEEQSYSEIIDRSTSSSYQFRVEEVPKDQLEIGQNEHLFPVAHFDKEPCRMFGVPFLIKISEQESFKEIKEKLKQLLRVNDKEYEKYKFHIIMNNRIVRDLGEGEDSNSSVENFSEYLINNEKRQPINIEPYLGIDHFNKMRGMRGGLSEKAIVIHN